MRPVWSFIIHANLRWRFGPVEWLISSPAFHHWHHAKDGPESINRNYAALFPVLDRLFGTFHLPAQQWPARYGIDTPLAPGLSAQVLHPFAQREQDGDARFGSVTDATPDAGN